MIIALLVLIVLILLFGAAAVKGWIANAAVAGCGFIAICLALVWVGSFFGKNGFAYLLLAIAGLMLVLAAIAQFVDTGSAPLPKARKPGASTHPLQADRPRPSPKPGRPPEPKAVDRVWGWFSRDIALRFSPEARATAHELYDAGNAHGLDRFCREEIARLQ